MCFALVKGFVSLLRDDHDGLTTQARAPLDPSTVLRVSGPTVPGEGSPGSAGGASRRDGFRLGGGDGGRKGWGAF